MTVGERFKIARILDEMRDDIHNPVFKEVRYKWAELAKKKVEKSYDQIKDRIDLIPLLIIPNCYILDSVKDVIEGAKQ